MNLHGRRVLITGANQGFGLAIARTFARAGAKLCLCARDAERLEAARIELSQIPGAEVVARAADISIPEEVRAVVSLASGAFGGLDACVCNAGIYGPKGPIEENDWDEWLQAIQINLVGTVLTCREVLPLFKQQRSGKILIVSGGGATKPMPFLSAYATSKAGVVRFAETLAAEVAEFGIDVNSIAPGALNTRLLGEVLDAGPERVGRAFYEASLKQQSSGGDSPEQAAALCAYLASEQSNGVTGRLISAKWDPWTTLHDHVTDLCRSDVYTLRRIVPADRGQAWGDVA